MFIFFKIRDLEKTTRSWKVYVNFKKFTDIKKLQEYEWAPVKTGVSQHQKPVKTESRDEPCPVSVVGGASCPVLKLKDQI